MIAAAELPATDTPIRLLTLPNALSLLSLNLGAWATAHVATHPDRLLPAAIALLAAIACDFLDGRVARATGTGSPLGVQLDSLADVVSFGIAPAAMLWAAGLSRLGPAGMLGCAVFASCAALRLARFNLRADEGPKTHFEGLPTTGAAAIVVLAELAGASAPASLALAVALGGLMVSDVRFLAFKVRLPRRVAVGALAGAAALAWAIGPVQALLVLLAAYLGYAAWENGAQLLRRARTTKSCGHSQ